MTDIKNKSQEDIQDESNKKDAAKPPEQNSSKNEAQRSVSKQSLDLSNIDLENGYKIGAVANMTGIAPNTIRVWERRYQAVVPARSHSGGRIYTNANVTRLKQLQQAIQMGDSIGQVASLDDDALLERLNNLQASNSTPAILGSADNTQATQQDKHLPLVLIGPTIAEQIKQLPIKRYEVLGQVTTITEAAAHIKGKKWNLDEIKRKAILFIETESVTLEFCQTVNSIREACSPKATIIHYGYGMPSDLRDLQMKGVLLIRQPTDANTLATLLNASHFSTAATPPESSKIQTSTSPSRFTKRQLLSLSRINSNIACECPTHIAELLVALKSFEQYSLMCEDRSEDDAALHAMLAKATAHARETMEIALTDLLKAEGINLPEV